MWRRPLLEVRNGCGFNVMPVLAGLLLEVSVSDKAGKESDSARVTCIGSPGRVALPKRGDTYTVLMGWADEGLVNQGQYALQKATLSGDLDQGETMGLTFRAADFVDRLKASGHMHYDATTYGDLMKTLGARLASAAWSIRILPRSSSPTACAGTFAITGSAKPTVASSQSGNGIAVLSTVI